MNKNGKEVNVLSDGNKINEYKKTMTNLNSV